MTMTQDKAHTCHEVNEVYTAQIQVLLAACFTDAQADAIVHAIDLALEANKNE
jgi:hypothetical protein